MGIVANNLKIGPHGTKGSTKNKPINPAVVQIIAAVKPKIRKHKTHTIEMGSIIAIPQPGKRGTIGLNVIANTNEIAEKIAAPAIVIVVFL